MDAPVAQRLLDIIYQDPNCRRVDKESLTDWILDAQPRTAPLDAQALVQDLAAHQVEPKRLKINVRLKEELARSLGALHRN